MLLSKVLERFIERTPITVMARAAMEHALAGAALDELFESLAETQYTRDLLFSSVVDLMSVVVCKIQPTVHAAYQAAGDSLPVSITSLYNKLNGTEPGISSALARHTAERLTPVVVAMRGQMPEILPGHRVRIIDGNHFAATERRLKVLKGSIAGPLPGHALVVLDPQLMLATHMIPCEDGHAQERSLTPELLDLVVSEDVWLADRNFCTTKILAGIASKGAFYVIRHHAGLPVVEQTALRKCGRTETGDVFEQNVTVKLSDGDIMTLRRVVLRLDVPIRGGATEMAVLTNLLKATATGVLVAEMYRKRWTLETMFQSLTQMLQGEIDTLAYPRAALLGFAIALASYNVLSTVQAALRGAFGAEKVNAEVSGYYVANEVRTTMVGMSIAVDVESWNVFQTMPAETLGARLLAWAKKVRLPRYKRHPRGVKKPVPKRTRFAKETHVSTARLLAKAKKTSKRTP